MENLEELIDRLVPEIEQRGSGVTKTLLLKSAQISDNQLRGTLLAPEVLRTIAGLLDCPYAVVLGAALHGSGYVDSTTDLLSGHTVHVVANSPWTENGVVYPGPSAVFTDGEQASLYENVTTEVGGVYAGEFDTSAVVINAAPIPPAELVYTTRWDYRNVASEQSKEYRSPEMLKKRRGFGHNSLESNGTGQFRLIFDADYQTTVAECLESVPVWRIDLYSLDPDRGRELVEDARRKLGARQGIAPIRTENLRHREVWLDQI